MLEYQGDDDLEQLDWEDDDDFVTVRPGGFRVLRAVLVLAVLLFFSYYVYTGVRGWFESQLDPGGEQGEPVTFIVPAGASTGDIAEILEANEVVPNSTFFRYYVEWKSEGNFQAGEYSVPTNSSVREAIDVLAIGPEPPVFNRFGVPEGLWLDEMLPRLAEQLPNVSEIELREVLDSGQLEPRYRPPGQASWEGLLFPAFYEIEDDATAREVLAKMNDEFSRVTGELGYGAAETQLDLSAYEVVIIASMIEAEAKTDGDRPKIARVIYNRLREQRPLDIDATCIYGSGDRRIELTTEFMNTGAEQYACRNFAGLPPTPISSPSKASLEAAINPADGPWMFYVLADEQGNHKFTETLDEHNKAVAEAKEKGLF